MDIKDILEGVIERREEDVFDLGRISDEIDLIRFRVENQIGFLTAKLDEIQRSENG